MKKRTKKILLVIAGIVAAIFVYMRLFMTDKFGGRMTVDSNGQVTYKGKPVSGYIVLGSLKLENGYWTGAGGGPSGPDGNRYRFNGTSFEKI